MKFKYATMAAAMLAATGASAADLGRPAPAAVDYVKVCDAYGTGFFYIPGTETCLKIDGYVRADYRYGDTTSYLRTTTNSRTLLRAADPNAVPPIPALYTRFSRVGTTDAYFGRLGGDRTRDDMFTRARALLHFDARTNTEFGLLRSYIEAYWSLNSRSGGSVVATELDQAFVQFGGLTAGRAQSFYDYVTGVAYGMDYHSMWGDAKTNLFAYTFSFGNGISASLSLEDPSTSNRRRGSLNATYVDNFTFRTITNIRDFYGFAYQGMKYPDVVGQLRISQAWGSAQLMAVAHNIYGAAATGAGSQTRLTGTANKDDWGYSVGAGVLVNLPMLAAGDQFFLQGNYSDGAIGYACANCFTGFGALGADAVLTRRGGFKTTEAWTVSAGFKHNFSAQWEFNIDGGYGSVDGYGANDYDQYEVAADVRWKPVAGLQIGLAAEYRNVEFTNATRAAYSGSTFGAAPTAVGGTQTRTDYRLRNNDAFILGLRVQRNF
ncbi:porin [Prosthecomicrobium sp. N25]|uniref:porin n=1 Tax=Prosthecomicrobium sp. N25 TaxID=3129254 RepID=UPI0030785A69